MHGFAGKQEGGFQPFCLLKMKLSYNWTRLIMFVKTVHVMVCLKGVGGVCVLWSIMLATGGRLSILVLWIACSCKWREHEHGFSFSLD